MIKGTCFTNLDKYKACQWPDLFHAIPNVGDCVEAADGRILKVVQVTHKMDGHEPVLRIELHEWGSVRK